LIKSINQLIEEQKQKFDTIEAQVKKLQAHQEADKYSEKL
jgi:hypothetical protein